MVLVLGRKRASPIECEVKMGAPIIQFTAFPRGCPVVEKILGAGFVQSLAEDTRFLVAELTCDVLKGDRESQKFTKGVPPKMVFRIKLLNVFRSGAPSPGLEQAASVHERNNREHFGAGAYLENREEIREIIPQDVTSYRNGVLARFEPF